MSLFDIYGNSIDNDLNDSNYTHTVIKTHEVEGGTSATFMVDVSGCIAGSLMVRGGGSYMPYKVYGKNDEILDSGTSFGTDYIYPESSGAVKVELTPTSNATVVWAVEESTSDQYPNEYRYGRRLIWHDEFDTNSLDMSKWYEEKAYNRRGSERGDGTNAFVQNGNLYLRIMRENQYLENHTDRAWSGEVLHSYFQYKYGLAEAKIKFAGKGAWMSFWALGANVNEYPEDGCNEGVPWTTCGELDFCECNAGIGIYGNIHYDAGLGNEDDSENIYSKNSVDSLTTEYHIISCEWTEDTITWYVDYHKQGSVSVEDYKTSDAYNAFRLPMHLLFSSQPILSGSNYMADDTTNILEGCVEWVRVYAPEGWENNEPIQLLIDGNDGSEIVEFHVGDTHDWNITINPEQVVNQTTAWTSSQPNVASVCNNGGHIECLAEGYTTITAKMWNGVQTSIVVHVNA